MPLRIHWLGTPSALTTHLLPALPDLLGGAVDEHIQDQTTQVMAMTWKVTEHMIFRALAGCHLQLLPLERQHTDVRLRLPGLRAYNRVSFVGL